MTAADWQPVATALLGSWPSQVASWGREALAAYIAEIGARGVSPEQALVAIRSCPAGDGFPPSAPELAALVRTDPAAPTVDEAVALIRGALRAYNRPLVGDFDSERAMIAAREQHVREAAAGMHPDVADFVVRCDDLRRLERDLDELADDEWGWNARERFAARWHEHCRSRETRDVASLVAGRRGQLGAFDPLASLDVARRQIGAGEGR